MENGYPLKFITRNRQDTQQKTTIHTDSEQTVYINSPFKGDAHTAYIEEQTTKCIFAAKLIILDKNKPIHFPNLGKEDKSEPIKSQTIN